MNYDTAPIPSPINSDYKPSDPLNVSAQKPAKRPAKAHQGVSSMGAVRRNSGQLPEQRLSPKRKIMAAGLIVAAGGLTAAAATQSDRINPENLASTIPGASLVPVPPETPTFFFADAKNALGKGKQLLALVDTDAMSQPARVNRAADPFKEIGGNGNELHTNNTLLDSIDSLSPDKLFNDPIQTVTVSPMVNHPSIAALRERIEAPKGVIETVIKVKSGNTLSGILNDQGITVDQMPQLLTDDIVKKYLSNLKIGQQMTVRTLENGEFHSLSTRIGSDRKITIRKSMGDFAVAAIDLPVEKERVVTSGTIEQSLYAAAEQANLKQSTIMELSDIFQWELDFARDIRKGDQFSLVYDRLYREGKYIGDGDILAAEFVRAGKTHRAIRFTDDEGVSGYYSPDGRSKRRTFLRHPVDVVRITSKFDPKRMHPVLHKIRAHHGVDYGSPHGTPIRATADGKVVYSGNKSTYGKTVILKHGQKFSTLYAHMSKISAKSDVGKKIKQGEVIGYVGRTGRVTGTHLHYEFRINGAHVDPLKVQLPEAKPIAANYRDDLRLLADDMIAQMRSVITDADTQVAINQ